MLLDRKITIPAYYAALALACLLGIVLRLYVPEVNRAIVPGDETTYHYAALDILKYGTLTREVSGDMYNGRTPAIPTSWLSPGYPLYLAGIYALFGVSTKAVLASQVGMSILMLLLVYKLLELLELNRAGKLVTMALVAIYPGFIYNVDRLLTEQLFIFLLLLYAYLFLKGWKQSRIVLLAAAGVVLACAGHVRAQAMPFALLSVLWLAVYGSGDARRKMLQIAAFTAVIVALFIPWWIRNYLAFSHFILFTEAGDGARIWGAVPYFIDMASNDGSYASIVQRNLQANPAVYHHWRLFGFLQYMWGDVWDEHLVHPGRLLGRVLFVQPLIVVPTLLAVPLIALRRSAAVLFVAMIPLAFTLMNFPYHGLPRYVYPCLPFVLILTGVVVSYLTGARLPRVAPAPRGLNATDQLIRYGFAAVALPLALLTAYSVYVFAQRMNLEMSAYRLGRYMGVQLDAVESAPLVQSRSIPGNTLTVENTKPKGALLRNTQAGPAIVHIDDAPSTYPSTDIVTKVTLKMHGGYLYDYTTVYWTGAGESISENRVYKFPNHAFARSRSIYIDGDVTHLMIVPYVFRGGSFAIQSIEIRKYLVKHAAQP